MKNIQSQTRIPKPETHSPKANRIAGFYIDFIAVVDFILIFVVAVILH